MSFRDLIAMAVKLLQQKCPKKSWILVWRAKDCGKRIWQNEKGNMWEKVEKACVGWFQVWRDILIRVGLKCVKDSFSLKGLSSFSRKGVLFLQKGLLIWLKLFIRVMFDI